MVSLIQMNTTEARSAMPLHLHTAMPPYRHYVTLERTINLLITGCVGHSGQKSEWSALQAGGLCPTQLVFLL
jgi:hypothetical protein